MTNLIDLRERIIRLFAILHKEQSQKGWNSDINTINYVNIVKEEIKNIKFTLLAILGYLEQQIEVDKKYGANYAKELLYCQDIQSLINLCEENKNG